MIKQLHARFHQQSTSAPTLFGQIGDTDYVEFDSGALTRIGTGVYQLQLTEDRMDSQGNFPFNVCIHATLHTTANAQAIKVIPADVNELEVHTFDKDGNAVDVAGDFYISLFLRQLN